MKRLILATALVVVPMTVLAQEATTRMAEPVRADPVGQASAQQQEERALRQQVADLEQQVQQLKSQQQQAQPSFVAPPPTPAAESVRAQPAVAPAVIAQPAAVPVVLQPQPVAAPVVAPLVEPVATRLPAGTWVRVTRVSVTDTKVGGNPGLHVVAYVTIHGLPNVQFTFQAALVTPDGKVHTDVRGNPYVATRGVSTGDFDDTDDYGVDLSLKDLFTSSPPPDLGVQVRILDVVGGIVAESSLQGFRRP